MNQRLLFEYSPLLLLVCIAIGILYAYLLYNTKNSWGKQANRMLSVFRAVLVSCLALLLLGPILKLTYNEYEKPVISIIVDNSMSVEMILDSLQQQAANAKIRSTSNALREQGYSIEISGLDGQEHEAFVFNNSISDLNGAVRNNIGKFEGKNLAAVVVISDGIYNSGSSPLYAPSSVPIYTVGLGDSTERVDLVLRSVLYNKIAYQGNQYPLRTEVLVRGIQSEDVVVSVYQKGKLIGREKRNSESNSFLDFDFKLDAMEKGLQRIDVAIEPISQERNRKNNYSSVFIEVVEGKKKILLVAPAPHPDLKAIRAVVEQNANYEISIHIPGVKEASTDQLKIENIDLAIFQQAIDYSGKTLPVFRRLMEAKTSMWVMLGERSNIRQLAAQGIMMTYENPGQWDAVTPVINPNFRDFSFSDNLNNIFSQYPPISVPFGKFSYPAGANILLYQRIGRINTDRPLLFTTVSEDQKIAVLSGEGIWKWRLDEFAETQKTQGFDEVFSRLIQYLSTREDRRKFRSFPLQNEFTTSETVIFESQVYNELFEQVFGRKIGLVLTDERGEKLEYSYLTSPGNTRYRIGGLKEGVYKYTSSVEVGGAKENVKGEFLVTAQNIEAQNLTADFDMLRQWAQNSGGKFYNFENINHLAEDFSQQSAQSRIHAEESFHPLINLKIFFYFLMLLISVEWFTRKFLGGY